MLVLPPRLVCHIFHVHLRRPFRLQDIERRLAQSGIHNQNPNGHNNLRLNSARHPGLRTSDRGPIRKCVLSPPPSRLASCRSNPFTRTDIRRSAHESKALGSKLGPPGLPSALGMPVERSHKTGVVQGLRSPSGLTPVVPDRSPCSCRRLDSSAASFMFICAAPILSCRTPGEDSPATNLIPESQSSATIKD